MIWRDDDVLFTHAHLGDLLEVDDQLRAAGCPHTVAILAETLTPALAAVIRTRGMIPQLHGWAHDDLSIDEAAIAQLPAAVARITELCGQRPTVLYPPWNRTSAPLAAAAAALGLMVSTEKLSLEQFVRVHGDVPADAVINFHYWSASDRAVLREALAIVAAVSA